MNAILCRLAAVQNPKTKTAALAVIRQCRDDGISLPDGKVADLAAELAQIAEHIREVRSGRQKTNTPTPTFVERIAKRTKNAVWLSGHGLYRVAQSSWAGGKHTTTVEIGDTLAAKGDSYREWSSNGKWSGNSTTHKFTVRITWLTAVEARGLAALDGMLTLDAHPIIGHGPELFAASWVEQGRGFTLNVVSGYIARVTTEAGTYTYHAASARAAIDGVQRKAKLKPARRKGVVGLDKLARLHGDLPVYFEDSLAVGNCDSGTRNWCQAVGISAAGCTLAEVVAGYKLRPVAEALAVIRRVVRDRNNRQPFDAAELNNGVGKLVGQGRVVFDSEGGFTVENN